MDLRELLDTYGPKEARRLLALEAQKRIPGVRLPERADIGLEVTMQVSQTGWKRNNEFNRRKRK